MLSGLCLFTLFTRFICVCHRHRHPGFQTWDGILWERVARYDFQYSGRCLTRLAISDFLSFVCHYYDPDMNLESSLSSTENTSSSLGRFRKMPPVTGGS